MGYCLRMDTFDNGNKAITVNVHRFDSCKSNSICRPKTLKVFDKGIMLDGKIYTLIRKVIRARFCHL